MADVSEFIQGMKSYFAEHLRMYLESNGAEGHLVDATEAGGHKDTTAMVLKTIGRRSGNALLVPIFYDKYGDDFVIVASKAGSDSNPAWFLNLQDMPDVTFQVADTRYRASWRIATDAERAPIWKQLVAFYPPYGEYQAKTDRQIPVVLMTPIETISEL